jgi:hypothetical protein
LAPLARIGPEVAESDSALRVHSNPPARWMLNNESIEEVTVLAGETDRHFPRSNQHRRRDRRE